MMCQKPKPRYKRLPEDGVGCEINDILNGINVIKTEDRHG